MDKRVGHGMSGTKTYRAWADIKRRCNDSKFKQYKNYGGRGIKYDQLWNNFENFLKDMGIAPNGHSIDRINNDGDYKKSNCRWVTSKIQARNKSSNRLITYKGETKCIADWNEQFGFSKLLLTNRIDRDGLSIQDAFETPVLSRHLKSTNAPTSVPNPITYKGKTLSLTKWNDLLSFPRNTLYSRLKRGWSIKDAIEIPLIVDSTTRVKKRKP